MEYMVLMNPNPVFCKVSNTPLQLRKLMRKWDDNVKMDLEAIGLNVSTEYSCFRIGTVEGFIV
jgi:hypothetical protein